MNPPKNNVLFAAGGIVSTTVNNIFVYLFTDINETL